MCLRASVAHTKSKFDTVAESSLVVDLTQAVPDNGLPDAQLIRDLTVLESLRNQLFDSKVLSAGLAVSVLVPHALCDGQLTCCSVFVSLLRRFESTIPVPNVAPDRPSPCRPRLHRLDRSPTLSS